MGMCEQRARYEARLAAVHKMLYYAGQLAVELDDPGAADDIAQILIEITRLTEASLKGKLKRSALMNGQLSL